MAAPRKYKNETAFIAAIHRKLPHDLYRMKVNLISNNGVFDCYYSGFGGDCWVEYKYLRTTPVKHFNPKRYLSDLQQIWGDDRRAEGRQVMAVYGCPDGVFLQRTAFRSCDQILRPWLRDQKEVIDWILGKTKPASQ